MVSWIKTRASGKDGRSEISLKESVDEESQRSESGYVHHTPTTGDIVPHERYTSCRHDSAGNCREDPRELLRG